MQTSERSLAAVPASAWRSLEAWSWPSSFLRCLHLVRLRDDFAGDLPDRLAELVEMRRVGDQVRIPVDECESVLVEIVDAFQVPVAGFEPGVKERRQGGV